MLSPEVLTMLMSTLLPTLLQPLDRHEYTRDLQIYCMSLITGGTRLMPPFLFLANFISISHFRNQSFFLATSSQVTIDRRILF